jgi:hypothetical protein
MPAFCTYLRIIDSREAIEEFSPSMRYRNIIESCYPRVSPCDLSGLIMHRLSAIKKCYPLLSEGNLGWCVLLMCCPMLLLLCSRAPRLCLSCVSHFERVSRALWISSKSPHYWRLAPSIALSYYWAQKRMWISTLVTRTHHGHFIFFSTNWKWCSHVMSFTAAFSLRTRLCRAVYGHVTSHGSKLRNGLLQEQWNWE